MTELIKNMKKDEETVFALRSLYEKYGYSQYKMNKFEEYDLYVRNKDFLVSDNIITFTDIDGKLMALKPDVTLSIIKKGDRQKVYYNENVYRVPKGSKSFKEIMQSGLECIGDTDDYSVYEVLLLAAKSLESISEDFVLDISHLGVISEIMDSLDIDNIQKNDIIKCIGEKNTHDIARIPGGEKLQKLVSAYGTLDNVLPVLNEIYKDGLSESAKLLVKVVKALEVQGYKGKVRIDFSVLNDMNYYSGIVFTGFVNGIPTSILSGGQYDHLMRKLGRKTGAIGFAVYLDMLEQYMQSDKCFDIDTLIMYDENTELSDITRAHALFSSDGKSVMARATVPEALKYKQLVRINAKGEFTVENNA